MHCGCVETEKPPYSSGDVVFEPALLGDWVYLDGQERGGLPPVRRSPGKATHRIERAENGSYRNLALGGEKEVVEFTVFKLGDRYFLASKADKGRFRVSRLTISGEFLKIWWLNFERVLEAHPEAVKHKVDDFTTVLTGSTDELRVFLLKYADEPGVWNWKYESMQRVDGLKVTPAGLTGRKQRTLDYWAEMRLALQDSAPSHGTTRDNLSAFWAAASSEIGLQITDGVDADAVACGKLATELCDVMAKYTGKHRPTAPLASLVRESTGGVAAEPTTLPAGRDEVLARVREALAKLEMMRKKLSDRYKCEFLPIR